MRDADLEAFVEAIEAHLTALRGSAQTLSPRDFALARSWFEGGTSLAAVLAAVDRVAQEGLVVSLGACRSRVESLAATADPAGGRRAAAPAPTSLGGPYPEIQERLDRLKASLAGRDPAAAPLRRIEQISELLSVATRPNAEHVRRALLEIDAEVAGLAVAWAGAERAEAWTREARRAAERQRGAVTAAALEASLRRHVEQRAREELQLPRVSLL